MAESSLGRATVLSIIGAFVAGLMGLVFAYVHNWLGISNGGDPIPRPVVVVGGPPGETGGKEGPGRGSGRVFRGPHEVLSALAADQEKADEAARPRRRYLTLTHLHNNPTLKPADLDAFRAALLDLAGYLSPGGQAVVWRPVDPERTLYALDLQDLGWDADTTWRQVLKGYPYGLTYGTAADTGWREAQEKVQKLARSKLPWVRADWFLAAVVHPPLGGPNGVLKLPPREVPASVQAQAQGYAQQALTLEGAAAELARNEPRRLEAFLKADPDRLRRLGLAPLLEPDGKVKRETWESLQDATSPFQQVSAGLQYGTPLVFP
jgi:hypothetical protein